MEALKTDLTKTDKKYYKASKKPELIELGEYYYLTISGQSAPEDRQFLDAIEALYTVAYGIKFICKSESDDFTVPKMECYWYVNGGEEVQSLFQQTPRSEWMWQINMRMPDFVEHDQFFKAIHQARSKKPHLSNFDSLKFELSKVGLCAQILHIGSYEEEDASIQKLHRFIAEENLNIAGYHKEIYLSDPRRTAPEKLKTILRYQVSSK